MAKFSLRWLLAAMAYIALFIVSVCYYNEQPWTRITPILTIALLTGAVVAAIYRHGKQRAFWVGFSVFSWGYLLFIYGPFGVPRDALDDARMRSDPLIMPFLGAFLFDSVLFGQLTFAAIFGMLGGVIARYLHSTDTAHETRNDSRN